MNASPAPLAYDNHLWTPVSDCTLVSNFGREEIRLENDDSLLPFILAHKGPLLDFGCGAGFVAGGLIGGDAYAYDPSPVMRESARQYLPHDHVFDTVAAIPDETFGKIWCCLVLCIVDPEEVRAILGTVRQKMTPEATALFTICNPALCQTRETRLDYRFPSADFDPEKESPLPKWKKEPEDAGYGVTERHRPIEHYRRYIKQAGLKLDQVMTTPHYEFKGQMIPGDFIAFQCSLA